MSDDAPKSAYELAMERLRKKDREAGDDDDRPLSDVQKAAIAEVRQFYNLEKMWGGDRPVEIRLV